MEPLEAVMVGPNGTVVANQTVAELGGLDLLVNNVATQEPADDLTKLSTEQWDRTFRVNIYSYFWTTRAALRHLPDGGSSSTRPRSTGSAASG